MMHFRYGWRRRPRASAAHGAVVSVSVGRSAASAASRRSAQLRCSGCPHLPPARPRRACRARARATTVAQHHRAHPRWLAPPRPAASRAARSACRLEARSALRLPQLRRGRALGHRRGRAISASLGRRRRSARIARFKMSPTLRLQQLTPDRPPSSLDPRASAARAPYGDDGGSPFPLHRSASPVC